MMVNAGLAAIKLAAGIVGNTYALVADAVESLADIFASLLVWGGLAVAARPADAEHPYGHGKAEALATSAVAVMLLAAAAGIAIAAIGEIRTPHMVPAPWTLAVLAGVMIVKWVLSRRVHAVGTAVGSTAVKADAAHHLSDALTSAAAFIGITLALLGSRVWGGRWESADDWAALAASVIIGFNGISMLRSATEDLMDRMPASEIVDPIRSTALSVEGVSAVEKLYVRKTGTSYRVTVHVQADGSMSLEDAHGLGGRVKRAICAGCPRVNYVLVHMEPYQEPAVAER